MLNVKKICDIIEDRKQELFELLSELIRINSENFETHGNEKELAEHLGKLCAELGLEVDVYSPLDVEGYENHPDHLGGRGLDGRRNITARWRGENDADALMLMGHTDTVVIGDPEFWSSAPLSGIIKDGKIFGRGACDDKYALATALFVIKILREQGFTPRENILFTGYCDEERGGSNGALSAVLRYPTERIVNMDCKNFEIWHCASGGQECTYHFHTAETVDSAKLTSQAFPIITRVVDEFGERRRKELGENRFYKGTIIPDTSLRYMGFRAGNRSADLSNGEVNFLFYTDKGKDEIYAEFSEMEHILEKELGAIGIVGDGFSPDTRFFHYAFSDPRCESIQDMQKAAEEATGRTVVPCGSCLSDLSVILKYSNAEAFSFGIGRDFSIEGGAHQPNEFIGCDELSEFAKIIAAYIIRTLG